MTEKLLVTDAAAALIRRLRAKFGPLVFHQSGGCCEGSAPMCFRQRDFRIGTRDVLLGTIEDCPFYVGAATFPYWHGYDLTIDVIKGGVDSFSLEAADGLRFVTLSSLACLEAAD